ncbi:MAG: hypothetical protein R3E08_08875 [Thiotrichaceae bacterium]
MIVDSMRKFKQMAFEEGRIEGKVEGMQQGIEQGIQQGMEQGMRQYKLEIARAMLNEQLDIALIVRVTGLSESEVLQFKNVTI